MWDDGGATDGLEDIATEPSYHQFGDPSLGNALEQMRQLRIDCNTALVDMDKRQMVYVGINASLEKLLLICMWYCLSI